MHYHFPWRPPELEKGRALHPHSWFSPVIEQCRPPGVRQLLPYSGYYFGLGRWESRESRCGYVAIYEFHTGFKEREFPIEELESLRKRLYAITIPLGARVAAFDGFEGLIRVYPPCEGWIDFFWRNIEQPQWEPLLAFIRETRQRFLPDTSLRITPKKGMRADRLDVPLEP
jgi:hypothetical protein